MAIIQQPLNVDYYLADGGMSYAKEGGA